VSGLVCVCACVCVCVRERVIKRVCERVRARESMCALPLIRTQTCIHTRTRAHTHAHIHTRTQYVCIYMCVCMSIDRYLVANTDSKGEAISDAELSGPVCVCMCVCVRERDCGRVCVSARESARERERILRV